MNFSNVIIEELAHIEAPVSIKTKEIGEEIKPLLEKFEQDTDVIERLTGIKKIHFWEPNTSPSEVATQAARKVIEKAGIRMEDIDVVVNSSVSKDFIEPSIGALVHGNLNLKPSCSNFDISNACLGFLDAINILGNMIEREQIRYGLIVDGEGSRHWVEKAIKLLQNTNITKKRFQEYFPTLTLSSGAVAMVLCHKKNSKMNHQLIGSVSRCDTKFSRACLGSHDEMITDTSGMLMASIQLAKDLYRETDALFQLGKKKFDHYIVHQVSKSHNTKVTEAMGLDSDLIRDIYPEFGNIGPASVPIVLSQLSDGGRLKRNDRILLFGFGSGINAMITELQW